MTVDTAVAKKHIYLTGFAMSPIAEILKHVRGKGHGAQIVDFSDNMAG